jgi:transposase-like protein
MSDADLIGLGLNQHLLECPHCKKQTVHKWPGSMILFASAKCIHCGQDFLIALNKPKTGV